MQRALDSAPKFVPAPRAPAPQPVRPPSPVVSIERNNVQRPPDSPKRPNNDGPSWREVGIAAVSFTGGALAVSANDARKVMAERAANDLYDDVTGKNDKKEKERQEDIALQREVIASQREATEVQRKIHEENKLMHYRLSEQNCKLKNQGSKLEKDIESLCGKIDEVFQCHE
jgi:hypothetical protein